MTPLHIVFTIGHKLTGIGMYFNQARLIHYLQPFAHEKIQQTELDWINHLKGISSFFAQAVLSTNDTLKNLGKGEQEPPPKTPEEYIQWANNNHQWLMNTLPKDKLGRAIYLYGFALGEMMSTLTTYSCILDLDARLQIPLSEEIKNNQKIGLALLERWELLARKLGDIDALLFLKTNFLKTSSPMERVFIEKVETFSVEEKVSLSQTMKTMINELGELEETCTLALQKIDAMNPMGPSQASEEDQ